MTLGRLNVTEMQADGAVQGKDNILGFPKIRNTNMQHVKVGRSPDNWKPENMLISCIHVNEAYIEVLQLSVFFSQKWGEVSVSVSKLLIFTLESYENEQ